MNLLHFNSKPFILCLILVWLNIRMANSQRLQIPDRIMNRLRSAKTLAELLKHMTVVRTVTEDSDGYSAANPEPGSENIIVAEIPQEEPGDSCSLVTVCTPLPLPVVTGIYRYPKCVHLSQCLGGCCDSHMFCQPAATQVVRFPYYEFGMVDIAENGKPNMEQMDLSVRMINHTACNCKSCSNLFSPCTNKHEFFKCQCLCKNYEEKANCKNIGPDYRWDEEKCTCVCSAIDKSCPRGQKWDKNRCRCNKPVKFDDH